ncbi:MAG: hypothetical protein ACC700_18290 [Anaerolineales bacterium]
MTQSKPSTPKWVKSSRDSIEKIREKAGSIRGAGQEEIRIGLEQVTVANTLEREVDYIGRIVFQDHSGEVWNDEVVMASGTQLAGTLDNLYSRAGLLANYAAASVEAQEKQHGHFARAVSSTDTSSGSAVYIGAAVESRIHVIQPEYSPLYIDSPPERLTSREQHLEELAEMLVEYDAKFGSMLEGSEAALDQELPDHLSQAAHSMRDLFQQLLEHLAPNEAVEAQPWFKPTEGAPGGVSRRSRLRYLLYGSGESVDEGVIEQLDITAHAAKQSLDLCIARAHDHDPSLTDDEVRLAIDQARFSLAKVLELSHAYREDQSE